ncbi:hypothetical protein ACCAA_830011 [Candidatus Accumulibacter aalborgensis]|uniref:Uncharacterized protein n=1 Tax=Candidatus Accumulibacter aalborgensis TaxID=1860102 RepID=A0A1A8XYN0_9PROT|nr:hypothetical protein ACCAA_830011 [Candidatus Accumulibacter aalborgensis]
MTYDHIRGEGKAGHMGAKLMAVVAEGDRGRVYLAPTPEMEAIALTARPTWRPETSLPVNPRDFKTPNYGLTTFADLFTPRQLVALTTFSDLVQEARERVKRDAIAVGLPDDGKALEKLGAGATAYADVVGVYLALAVDKVADRNSTVCAWASLREHARNTWPMRTELDRRMIDSGTNALASSVVLVCRQRSATAPTATRREFVTALKTELPPALAHLQRGNIAPVDLAQAAIGPGMGVYTRYAKVLDAEGKPIPVRAALALINQVLDEALAEQEGEFDADTRWALTWFEQTGFAEGDYGVAEQLSKSKNTAAALVAKLGSQAETARELCYRTYTLCERKKRAAEAMAYNGLVQSWPEITRLARKTQPAATSRTDDMFGYE